MMLYRPEARRDDLAMEQIGGEVVVYDSRHRRAHLLNELSACVFMSSDGSRTVNEIAAHLQNKMGVPQQEELVLLAIDQLAKADLLIKPAVALEEGGPSRRVLLRLAGASAAIPIIESILAPSRAEARSFNHFFDRFPRPKEPFDYKVHTPEGSSSARG